MRPSFPLVWSLKGQRATKTVESVRRGLPGQTNPVALSEDTCRPYGTYSWTHDLNPSLSLPFSVVAGQSNAREVGREKGSNFLSLLPKSVNPLVGGKPVLSMGSCSLGALNTRIFYISSPRIRIGKSCVISGRRGCTMQMQNFSTFAGLKVSGRFEPACAVCCSPSSGEDIRATTEAYGEPETSSLASQFIPTSTEVESLIKDICNTSIAEFELKLGGFRLYVTRDTLGKRSDSSATSFAPAPISSTNHLSPEANGSLSKISLATKPLLLSDGKRAFLDRAADEGLVILKSPRVGFFRRCRTIKGKRAPPACKENQIVKEGQVLCYVEQLGGEIPIESDVSGEVDRILLKDGGKFELQELCVIVF
ncbi:hypothetical protein MLD38_040623 [Melastoma candidum]|nr:hypothetical protein MLD38_040623 [Melastoma candidum]